MIRRDRWNGPIWALVFAVAFAVVAVPALAEKQGEHAEHQQQQGAQAQQGQQPQQGAQTQKSEQAQTGQPASQGQQPQQGKTETARSDQDFSEAASQLFKNVVKPKEGQVQVDVEGDTLVISGEVNSFQSKQRLMEMARALRGIRDIQDKVEVRQSDRTDAQVQEDVQWALKQSDVDTSNLDVKVNEGKVTLSGEVGSWYQKNDIAEQIQDIRGVRNVDNNLKVGGQQAMTDEQMKEAFQRELRRHARLQGGDIEAEFKDGKATIRGEARNLQDRQDIEGIAYLIGAEDVDTKEVEIASAGPMDRMRRDRQRTPGEQTAQGQQEEPGGQAARGQAQEPGQTAQGRTQETERQAAVARAGAEGQPRTASEEDVRERIEEAFNRDPQLRDADIDVKLENRQITLEGEAPSLQARRMAERIASRTMGVASVENNIEVRREGVERAGAGQMLSEESLENAKRRIAMSAAIPADQIDLQMKEDKVYLFGQVANERQKERIEDLVEQYVDDERLESKLEVQPDEPMTDTDIAEAIESQFFWSLSVDGDDINVAVRNGTATLSGQVNSLDEAMAAVENAYEAGARKVVNQLQVSG